MGLAEILLILVAIGLLYALGRYGKETRLGFGGSVLLGIFTTPIVAFIIIAVFFKKNNPN